MKNILWAIIILIIWSFFVWWGRGWWDKRNIGQSFDQQVTETIPDSVGSEISHAKTDTFYIKGDPIPYIPKDYIHKDSIKSDIKKFAVEKQIDKLRETFTGAMNDFSINGVTGSPFRYKIITLSKSPVEIEPPVFYPNKEYFESLMYKSFEQGYRANGITWKQRGGYALAGMIIETIFILVLNKKDLIWH